VTKRSGALYPFIPAAYSTAPRIATASSRSTHLAGGPPAEPPALVLPAYEDVGADGRENDEDEPTKMRTFYGITESPDEGG